MHKNESIFVMFSRFTNIVNKLKALNKDYTQEEKVMKVLHSLPKKKWRPMVTAIQNTQDLENLSLDELMGMLQTHEVELQDDDLEEQEESRETRKNAIALKMTHGSDKEESEDEQILLLSRHFHKFLKSKKGRKLNKGQPSRDNKGKNYSNEKSNEVICYECRNLGHIKPDCPNLLKEEKKKKAYKAEETWDDSSDSSDEESGDEHTYLVLMAASDQEEDKICLKSKRILNGILTVAAPSI
ncbi:ecto-NOX disulfide-thiol exchanger 2-like isoform X2 [Macadamia integrifolia]|uniref:ecto-NOX disulfide-thiol exchanger 2-like isoform X2 n=1 Tax=Macadamia integrifolia TaxID=60698 RepID=UPI001C4FDE22|nr:ecto-NOX disulfide-thiol exchanger 2-like isoform X2 [Macadamia integrifolia]XP_042495238.1 ecto-NOX disulfide-thiol exchanger 2-like isoform X2 [Macadamia integrifolia]